MRILILSLFLLTQCQAFAQKVPSVPANTTEDIKIKLTKRYKKSRTAPFDSILYLGKLPNSMYQALTNRGDILYFDYRLKKKQIEDVQDRYGLCGTVPHYTLSIKEDQDSLYAMIDETFFDSDNQTAAEAVVAVSKKKADRLIFQNGTETFNYTSNYAYYQENRIDPQTILFVKGEKYGVLGISEEANFDQIQLQGGLLFAELDGKYGYIGIQKTPKYSKLGAYIYKLASFELEDGRKGYVDIDGVEYFIDSQHHKQ